LTGPLPDSPGVAAGTSQAAWRALALALATAHVSYVVFVLFGALLIPVWAPFMWVHLAAVAWAGGTMVGDLGCPITTWEKDALRKGGREPYPEGFLQHHVLRTRFNPANARRNHAILGLAAIGMNVAVYWTLLGS